MEVLLLVKNKRISVRLSDKEAQVIDELKEAFYNEHLLSLSDSDIVRQALLFVYTVKCEGVEQ